MAKRKFRYDGGGDVTYGEDERPAATGMSAATELMPEKPKAEAKPQNFKEAFAEARKAGDKTFMFGGKKYTTEMAGAKPSAPVAGRPRGESVGEPKRPAPMFAQDADTDRNIAAAAVRNREAAAERLRESRRRSVPEGTTPKRGTISMAGVNPKTLLPERGYAKGGSVRGDGCARKGHTKGTMR